jgi:hypothetical protein
MLRSHLNELCELLLEYFCKKKRFGYPKYSGSQFDKFDIATTVEQSNRITGADIVSLSFLSINLGPNVAQALLFGEWSERISNLLQVIPANASIYDDDAQELMHWNSPEGPARRLWGLLHASANEIRSRFDLHLEQDELGLGPTTVSKIMARKRTHLVPIIDSQVRLKLNLAEEETPDEYWEYFMSLFREHGAREFVADVRSRFSHLYPNGCSLDEISDLRVFDVIIWMAPRVWFQQSTT